MKKNKLRRRSVRTLSAILTVMLIFSVVPAIPIFAGAQVKTLKLNVPEELGLTYIYDGSRGFDAFLYDDGTEETGVVVSELTTAETGIKFGTGGCKIKKESQESNVIVITAASGDATLPNIQLGVAITKEADKLTATVSSEGDSSGISASTSLVLDGTYYTKTYIGNIQMPFAARLNSGWSGITEENITVDLSVPAQTYTLTYNRNSTSYEVKDGTGDTTLSSSTEIESGKEFPFILQLTGPAKDNNVVPQIYAHIAKDGGGETTKLLTQQEDETNTAAGTYKYKLESTDITGDIELEITLLSALTVTLPQGEGYTADGDTTVPYGSESYEFMVKPEEGWDVKASYSLGGRVTQFQKNEAEEPADGKYIESQGTLTYTIKPAGGITSNITIYIVATKKTFSIKAEGSLESVAFTTSFVNQTAIPYNGQYSFTVTANTGYANPTVNISDAEPVLSIIDGASGVDKKIALFGAKPIREISAAKNATLSINGDYYTISEIKGDINVTISGGKQDEYRINKIQGDGYTLSVKKAVGIVRLQQAEDDLSQASYSDNLDITLKLKTGYTNSKPVLKIDGVQVQQAGSDEAQYTYKYTMPAKAITITVEDVTKNRYTVTLPESTEKYTVNKTTQEVEHGSSFEFTVKLNPGWEVTGITGGDYKALFTGFDGNAAGTVSADETKTTFTVTVGEGGVTKPLTFTIDQGKVTAKIFEVTVKDYTDEGANNNYKVEWVGDSHTNLAYGSSVSFSVSPKTGYVIGEVSYTMGENGVTKVLGNGPGSYTVDNITGDVEITVICTPIKVSVTYSYPDLEIFGKRITKASEAKDYTVGPATQITTNAGFTLTLEGPQEDSIKGVQFNGWTYNGSITGSINLGTLTVSADNTIYITVIADWELVVKDSANENEGEGGGAFYVESEKPAEGQHLKAPDEDGYYRVQVDGSLQSDLLEDFLSQLGLSGEGIKFLKAGLVYTNNELTYEKLESLREQLKNTTESQLLDDSTYVFVNDITDKGFGIGDKFSQRVNFGKTKPEELTRYAAIYFVIEVNGQRYVFFGAIQNLTGGQQ